MIELFIQGYFEFLISLILTWRLDDHTLSGEKMSLIVSWISFAMTLVLLPLSLIYILVVDENHLRTEAFADRFGELYSNTHPKDLHKRSNRAYFLIFIVRRIAFVYAAFYLRTIQIRQLLLVIFGQMAMQTY